MGSLRYQDGSLAAPVIVTGHTSLCHLHARGIEVNGGYRAVGLDHNYLIHPEVILPGHLCIALGRKITSLGIVQGHLSSAVYSKIKGPVSPCKGPPILGVAVDRDGNAGKGKAVPLDHLPPDDSYSLLFDSSGHNAGLYRIFAAVEKRGGSGHVGGDCRIDARRYVGRVRGESITAIHAAEFPCELAQVGR